MSVDFRGPCCQSGVNFYLLIGSDIHLKELEPWNDGGDKIVCNTCITHTVNNIFFWDDNMKTAYTSETLHVLTVILNGLKKPSWSFSSLGIQNV